MITVNSNKESMVDSHQENTISPRKILEFCGVRPSMNLADFGCGANGFFAIPMAKMIGPASKVYAIDVVKSALESLRNKADLAGLSNIITVWSNLEKVGAANVPRGTIDMCFIINTLFQSHQHREIIIEASAMIRPNGKIVIIDWERDSGGTGPLNSQRVSKDSIKSIANELGLRVIKEFYASQYHFGLILDKTIS